MYAVIRTGAAQEKVEQGQRVRIDLRTEEVGSEISLVPVLFVDGETVLSSPDQLAGVSVTAQVIAEEKGPKINAMTSTNKSNNRRKWGHRQRYSTVEITKISAK